ncbi:cytochrome c oxidase subunit II [Saccharicrinis fermentans]|uniref:Cytochrome c oxidase subunit 2 n=1 Tax=Saccharicrinis fermentans DSM 9555 = JCM 21142 TaxID=869213 RepID=W7Y4X2_9BACT|nr:cytochrome c oxidase subunit II [Saccharicrinis fermentans]GAF02583.1 cytochrome c oxidase subunit 2 precursor [Saccharicrinis fermentans DSM 9555 = JCM 21142]
MIEETTRNASTFVSEVDSAFVFIFGISLFFLFAITVFMVYYIIRYRKSKNPKATQIEGNNTLEIVWTVIPTILVIIMFSYGWAGWRSQKEIPEDAMPIKAVARMWSFSFQYQNGKITDTLIVPINTAVNLDLIAQDVIHSMYIPAFRVKQDMVPGKQANIWFESEKLGEYEIFCAEYCGLRHSYMKSVVKVIPEKEFEEWNKVDSSAIASDNPEVAIRLAANGIFRKYGCNACHTSDGSKLVGPSYKNIMSRTRTVIKDGQEMEMKADAEYIRRSIYDPNAEVVKGFAEGLMISYKDQVSEDEIQQLLEYFEIISGD